ncbi:hypothetical protein [Burkholderia ubonensis]|uniref:hypothetical protein n=1 Tax=Burkholderia ubonensis TaxID=101571 RepID=UPI0012FDBBA2
MRGTDRHQLLPCSLQRATSAPSVARHSPASRSATSGRNPRPTEWTAAGVAAAHAPAACSISCSDTGIRRGSPYFAIDACRCDTSTDEPSRSARDQVVAHRAQQALDVERIGGVGVEVQPRDRRDRQAFHVRSAMFSVRL